jgi:hypothetical protein
MYERKKGGLKKHSLNRPAFEILVGGLRSRPLVQLMGCLDPALAPDCQMKFSFRIPVTRIPSGCYAEIDWHEKDSFSF